MSDCFYCSKYITPDEKKILSEVKGGGFIYLHDPCPAMVKRYGKIIGSLGGKASAKSMTPEQRIERAKKAVAAREAKRNSVHTLKD